MAREGEQRSQVSFTNFIYVYIRFTLFYSKRHDFLETDVNHQTSNIGFNANVKPPSSYSPSTPIIPIHDSKPLFSSAPPQGNIYIYIFFLLLYTWTTEYFVKL